MTIVFYIILYERVSVVNEILVSCHQLDRKFTIN